MARNLPVNQHNKKIREATFHAPHELPRLNKEAPGFRLEDLGPLAPGWLPWETAFGTRVGTDGPPINAKDQNKRLVVFP